MLNLKNNYEENKFLGLFLNENENKHNFNYFSIDDYKEVIENKKPLFIMDINNLLKENDYNKDLFIKKKWHGINLLLGKNYENDLREETKNKIIGKNFDTYFESELKKQKIHPIHKFVIENIRDGEIIPENYGDFYIYSNFTGEIIQLTEEKLESSKKGDYVIQCGNFDIKQDDILNHLKVYTPHITLRKHHLSDDEFLGDVEIVYEIKIDTSLYPKKYIKLDHTNVEEIYNNVIGYINQTEYELDKMEILKMEKFTKSINLDLEPGESITVLIFHETDDFIQYIAHYNNKFDEEAPWVKRLKTEPISEGEPINYLLPIRKKQVRIHADDTTRFTGGGPYIYTGGVPYLYKGVTYIYLIQIARTISYITYFNYSETCIKEGKNTNEIQDCNFRHILKTCVIDFAISILSLWIIVELHIINTDTLETALTVIVLTWLALSLLRLASLAQDKRPSLFLKTIVTMVVLLIPLIIIR
jgi:hypothetical protein